MSRRFDHVDLGVPSLEQAVPFYARLASGGKLGIDATKQLPGEGFKHSWPPLIRWMRR